MKLIINCETGKISERVLNKSEKEQEAINTENDLAESRIIEKLQSELLAAKSELFNRLGITADEAKLLLS